jgi:hypothetical protein
VDAVIGKVDAVTSLNPSLDFLSYFGPKCQDQKKITELCIAMKLIFVYSCYIVDIPKWLRMLFSLFCDNRNKYLNIFCFDPTTHLVQNIIQFLYYSHDWGFFPLLNFGGGHHRFTFMSLDYLYFLSIKSYRIALEIFYPNLDAFLS